jgi:rare lipoprotein A
MNRSAQGVRGWRGLIVVGLALTSAACAGVGRSPDMAATTVTDPAPIVSGTMRPYQVRGRWYRPEEQPNYDEVGLASWYGDQFNGRPTATGEIFDMYALTAAHKTLPLPGLIEVTNTANGRRVVLRVNDRGPFVDGRILDLSRGAAQELDLLRAGVGQVRVRYLGRAPRLDGGRR